MDSKQLIITLVTVFLLLGLYYLMMLPRKKQSAEVEQRRTRKWKKWDY